MSPWEFFIQPHKRWRTHASRIDGLTDGVELTDHIYSIAIDGIYSVIYDSHSPRLVCGKRRNMDVGGDVPSVLMKRVVGRRPEIGPQGVVIR